jgi:hypothetical protein
MNKERKKLTWALGLVAGLGILSIAYAALSSTLYIKGTGNVETGQVMFTNCQLAAIGTDDTTVNESGGAHLNGDYSNFSGGYGANRYLDADANGTLSANDAETAKAFGVAGTGAITRSNLRSNHDGDTLTISDTTLYDYGSAVIYKVTLKNTAQNPMYLSQVPVVVANFSSTNKANQIDTNVAVSVHPSLAKAKGYTGGQTANLLSAYNIGNDASYYSDANAGTESAACNYLNSQGTCDWYIKVRKVVQDSPADESSANYVSGNEGYLENGSFKFTVNLADSSDYATNTTMKPAVWEASGKKTTNS